MSTRRTPVPEDLEYRDGGLLQRVLHHGDADWLPVRRGAQPLPILAPGEVGHRLPFDLHLEAGEPVDLDRLRAARAGVNRGSKVLVAAEVGLRLATWIGLARLGDSDDAENVALAQAEAGYTRLQLRYGRHAVVVVRL